MTKKKKILISLFIVFFTLLVIAGGIATCMMVMNKSKKDDTVKTANVADKGGIKPVVYDSVKDEYWDNYYLENFEYSKDNDTDGDGLNDDEEKNKYNTSAFSSDTDSDGLGDYNEVMTYKTDPNKPDTDEDGVLDGDEVMADLDPLKKSSDGKHDDGDRTFEEEFTDDLCTLNIKGKADIYSVLFSKNNITGMANTPGVVSDVYEVYTENTLGKGTSITIEYDSDIIEKSKIKAKDLSICTFEKDLSFKKIKSKVNEDDNTVTAEIGESGKYVLVANSVVGKEPETDVMLLIDDSGSMYSKDLCEDSCESDLDYKRVDMAKSLIEMTDDTINYGLATFTATYNDMCDIGSSKKELNSKLDGIKKQDSHNFDGTYIAQSIEDALDSFDEDAMKNKKYIVLLTDGATTEGGLFDYSSYDEDDAIKDAKEKNVTVIVVALGNDVDTDYLTKISSGTGGTYIYASNANALEQLYNAIINVINYNYEDTDGDNLYEELVLADSGFDVNVDAFSFHNMYLEPDKGEPLQEGLCSGMATFAELYYMGRMPAEISEMKKTDYDNWGLRGFAKLFGAIGLVDASDVTYDYLPGFGSEMWEQCGFETNADYVIKGMDLASFTTKDIDAYEKYESTVDKDAYEIKDGKLVIKDKVKDSIKSPILTTGYSSSVVTYDGIESKLPVAAYTLKAEGDLSDDNKKTCSMLYILYRLWYAQFDSSNYDTYNCNDDFDNIVNMLNTGNPLYVLIPGHAINAISLSQDIYHSDTYYLRTYDNNYPGQERIYYIIRKVEDGEIKYKYLNPTGEEISLEFHNYKKIK